LCRCRRGHAGRSGGDAEQHVDLVARERRGGLIQHQHARSAPERPRDLHQLLLANAQIADTRLWVEVDGGFPQQRARPQLHLVPVDAAQPPRQRAEEQVLGDRHLREQRQLLVDDGDAGALRVARRAQRRRRAIDDDRALVAAVRMHAREQFDQRRLAGAVFTAERVDFAGAQREADTVERGHAAEALDDAARLEDRGRAHGRGGRRAAGTPR
jgi:hypothetical protein